MRTLQAFFLGAFGAAAAFGQGKWGMVDTNGVVRIPARYDDIGVFRGDLGRGLTLPEFLPGLQGAKIIKWLKAEGAEVQTGEALAEVELKEPVLPVAAPAAGMLTKINVPKGGAAIPGSSLGKVRVLGKVDLFAQKHFEVVCPSFGPKSGSATVIRWLKLEGDTVIKGETIAEIRPVQAVAPVVSPGPGTLVKIEIPEGNEAGTGQVIARMGMGRVPVQTGRDWFYVDERGNRVSPTQFDQVGVMQGGMAPVRIGDRWGFVDSEGKLIGQAEFDEAREVWGGLAAVRKKARWGFVAYEASGLKNAVPPRFLQVQDFREGLAAVEESDDAPMGEERDAGWFGDKPEQEKSPAGKMAWGYIIPSGKLHIPREKARSASPDTEKTDQPFFAEAGNFLDGRAAVLPSGAGASWVLIDSKGKVRTSGTYQALVPLGARRVAWKRDSGWGLMDFQEKEMEISPAGAESLQAIGPFGNERAPAKDASGKWGYLDPDGQWAISPKFERAGLFRNGLAPALEPGGKWGFLRPDGSWGIEPRFSRVRSFSDGLAAVREAGGVETGPEPVTGGRWE